MAVFVLLAAVISLPARANAPAPVYPESAKTSPVTVPPPTELALEHDRSGNWLWLAFTGWSILVPAAFAFSGYSARLRSFAQGLGRYWLLTILFYVVFASLLAYLADWPLSYYAGYIRPHDYGLSNQSFERWFTNSLKSLAVGLIGGCLIVWVPYLLMRWSPRAWWLWTSLLLIPIVLITVLIVPIWVDPLFNRFGPMRDHTLEADILALAHRAGIDSARVYEVDKSADTNAVNAYVTGLGATQRIVLWDTLLAKLDRHEVLAVLGHEMGHYVLGHVLWTILFLLCLLPIAFYLLHRTASWIIARYQAPLRFSQLSDIASLPLLLALGQVGYLLFSPAVFALSRYHEHEADRFALEITHDNHAVASAFAKLQQNNLGVPWHGWLRTIWRDTHPTIGERIEFCNDYHPWRDGQPLHYGAYFPP